MARLNVNKIKVRNYLLLGVAAYLLFVLLSVPASVLNRYLLQNAETAADLRLQQVRGTVWRGEAQQAMLGRTSLGRLTWNLNSLGLLVGNLDMDVHLKDDTAQGGGNVALGLGGKLTLQDIEARLAAEKLNGLFHGLPVSIGGNLHGIFNELEFKKNEVLRARGRVVWQQAALVSPQNVELGDILIVAEPFSKNTRLTITDQSETGQLKIKLKLDVQYNGKYRWEGTLTPRNNDQQKLAEFLRFLGRPDSTGNYWISRSGQLAGF
jgi:general secretion pathway protein N